jgi:hypothetical protein
MYGDMIWRSSVRRFLALPGYAGHNENRIHATSRIAVQNPLRTFPIRVKRAPDLVARDRGER